MWFFIDKVVVLWYYDLAAVWHTIYDKNPKKTHKPPVGKVEGMGVYGENGGFLLPLYATQQRGEVNKTNTRIRKLRKALDLTQQEFALRIGSTQNAVTGYETGRRNPSSSVINNICKEFHVNEEWLRTGRGEMLQEMSRDDEITAFVNDVLRDESDGFRRRLIAALSHLDAVGWSALEQLVEDTARKLDDPWYPWDIDAQPPPRVPPGYASRAELERDVDQEVERYRQQLLSEKQRASQALSAKESGAG